MTIKFTVGQITNAVSVKQIEGLKVTVNAFGRYAVDDFEGPVGWIPIQGTFLEAKVKTSSQVSYKEDTTYTIMFTPKHLIPVNGYIEVQIPSEI